MELVLLAGFIVVVNAAIDTGKYQDISISEVEEHIEKRDLIPYLKNRLGKDMSILSLYDSKTGQELNEKLEYTLRGYKGRERRKLGVENSGLCLLVAFVIDIIQQRDWN